MTNISKIAKTVKNWPSMGKETGFTQLQVHVMFWLAHGFTYPDIATKLNYSYNHIHHTISALFKITKTANKGGLVTWAFLHKVLIEKNGKIEVGDESD